jgi:hypothetical protein
LIEMACLSRLEIGAAKSLNGLQRDIVAAMGKTSSGWMK